MAATGFKGIDVRQTANGLIFRASLKNSSGAILATGTTELRLFEVQDDGTLKVFDFYASTLAFTAGTPTDDEATMTHRTHKDQAGADRNTGVWTYLLSDVTGFTKGAVYVMQVTNSGASPVDQEREFQFGDVEGDVEVTATNRPKVDAEEWAGHEATSYEDSGTFYPNVNTAKIGGLAPADALQAALPQPTNFSSLLITAGGIVSADLQTCKTRAVGDVGVGNTAHLLQQPDYGATARALEATLTTLRGGDEDTLETLSDQLDTIGTAAGAAKTAAEAVQGKLPAGGANMHAAGAAVAKSDANVVDWKGATAPAMTGDAYARLGTPAGGVSISADVAAVHAKTTNLPASPAAVGSAMTLATGAITYSTFGSSAITAGAFASDAISADSLSSAAVAKIVAGQADVYTAKVTRGRNGNTEIYLVNWFKNGVAIVTGVTDATITVMPVTTPASPLISAATLNGDGLAYGYLYYSANPSTEKSAAGVMYGATLSAVIGGDTRTFPWGVVKDA